MTNYWLQNSRSQTNRWPHVARWTVRSHRALWVDVWWQWGEWSACKYWRLHVLRFSCPLVCMAFAARNQGYGVPGMHLWRFSYYYISNENVPLYAPPSHTPGGRRTLLEGCSLSLDSGLNRKVQREVWRNGPLGLWASGSSGCVWFIHHRCCSTPRGEEAG